MGEVIFQALNKVNAGIVIVDRNLEIILWNQWIERFTELKNEEVLGRKLTEICPGFENKMYLDIIQNVLCHGQSRFCSSSLHKALFLPKDFEEDDSIKQNLHIEPLYQGDITYALIQINDVTTTYNRVYKLKNLIKEMEVEFKEMKNTEKRSRHLSLHDPLTGLPNRLHFNDRLGWAINYAKRNKDKFAVMFLDLDGFKEVNDSYGHQIGDRVLKEVAHRLKGCIRGIDTLSRLGGDEFICILIQLKNEQDASIVARKFIHAINEPFFIKGNSIHLSISIGISSYPKDGTEPTTLFTKADNAMYNVKNNGKNGYRFSD